MVDVFVSYKREDREAARALVDRLSLRKYDIWWDVELLSGDAFVTEIYQMLKRSRAVVVLWSEKALTSRYVIGEALAAENQGVYLGAMLEPKVDLPPPFNVLHAHDLSRWRDTLNVFDDLLVALDQKLAASQPAGASPEPPPPGADAISEVTAWRRIADGDDPQAFAGYLAQFGEDSLFAPLAKVRIDQLRARETTAPSSFAALLASAPTPETTTVPAGSFWMGSTDGEDDERPMRRVEIASPFELSRAPVSFAEYDAFCEQTGRPLPRDQLWGRGAMPAINVTWHDADAYCAWLSARTAARWRLPSEAEWEYAARAGSTSAYWWGDAWSSDRANAAAVKGRTSAPGEFAASPWGLGDMAGNVWEWCADDWHDGYLGAPEDGRVWRYRADRHDEATGDAGLAVIRGGSWDDLPSAVRSAARGLCLKTTSAPRIGFRVVREA